MSRSKNSQLVVCDASPLIFLAKLGQLDLLHTIPGGECVVVEMVARELLSDRADPVEKSRLEAWLNQVRIIRFAGKVMESQALSASDHASLAWAVQNRAAWIVADERLLRRFARDRGIKVVGFCGILIKAAATELLSIEQAHQILDDAVTRHQLRLSLAVYQAVLRQIAKCKD